VRKRFFLKPGTQPVFFFLFLSGNISAVSGSWLLAGFFLGFRAPPFLEDVPFSLSFFQEGE